jgi:hypothetical protein
MKTNHIVRLSESEFQRFLEGDECNLLMFSDEEKENDYGRKFVEEDESLI